MSARLRSAPLVLHVVAPFAGRAVAISTERGDCRLILERLAARKRREARGALDAATAKVILTEATRYEKLIELLEPVQPLATSKARGPDKVLEAAEGSIGDDPPLRRAGPRERSQKDRAPRRGEP